MAVDWSHRSDYIVRKHGVTAGQANEALADSNAVVFAPDYNSDSGESVRTIGDSPSFGDILAVITVEEDGVIYGVNAWKANQRDRRYYEQGGPQ
ncbi:transposase [Mycolicibacterium sp. (ex Dasyatis americana)]|nr:transposase [Mycolicibacterium sp. (ex Dasyatis americana)]